jgi:hypothetical protein
MPILSVSLNNETPSMRTVLLRTPKLIPGVLCEVWVDDRLQLCVVDRVEADGSVSARRLPAPSVEAHSMSHP